MKTLMEEYGVSILAAVGIAILIIFVGPLKEKVREILDKQGKQENIIVNNTMTVQASPEMTRIRAIFDNERNGADAVMFTYETVYNQHQTDIESITQSAYWMGPLEEQSCYCESGSCKTTGDTFPGYSDGSAHSGSDYAGNEIGTPVRAPANGIIVESSSGCSDGFLGDKCSGHGTYAIAGGGNQIWMLTSMNGKMYLLAFFHLQNGTLASDGVVSQGDVIGKVGTSGSSTGPHLHIEAFYLGEGNIHDNAHEYMTKEHSISWGCGWGTLAASRINACGRDNYDTLASDIATHQETGTACRFSSRYIFDNLSTTSDGRLTTCKAVSNN